MSELPNDVPINDMWAKSSPWGTASDALQEKGSNVTQEVSSCR